MDDFVRNKLTEWGLSELTEKFEEEGIDEESLYCLRGQEIDNLIPKLGPRAKFKKRLKLLQKEQNATNRDTDDSSAQEDEGAASSAQVQPSTIDTNDKRKRKSDLPDEPSKWQAPKRRCDPTHRSYKEKRTLCDVKNIMRLVHNRYLALHNINDNKLSAFLRTKISDLEIDKRELVGVFGKTGAGKSSLINAIIGEKDLLPSGSLNACTSCMIEVKANPDLKKYEADIEFITKEEWRDELWSLFNFLRDDSDQEKDEGNDDDQDTDEKLSALYGEEWRNKSPENLLDNKYFREIPEFLQSKRKTLTCETAKELSVKLSKYTRSDSKEGEGKEVKKWYWPLVKCVTVRVPNNDLLQHVTLVDLPGNNDRNKSRDEMWKRVVGNCSTVWIVTDMNRAAAEKETWEILKNARSHIGNGGQCQQIHFICTKSDLIEDLDDHSAAGVRAEILKKNMQAKEAVTKEFNKLNKVKQHFSNDCFKVFTVSSKEFLKKKRLNPDDTEIPKLQEFLQNLNDCHSETLNYVSGAHGILCLIQGARCGEATDNKAKAYRDLEETMRHELEKVIKPMEETYKAFEKCLNEGVEKSKTSCDRVLCSVLYPSRVKGPAFHKRLRCVVENNGTHKPKKGKPIQLNVKLASCLTDSIDEEFKKTFPNEGKSGPFNGAIEMFSLDTESLIQKYKDVELQLIFLKTEEEKIKTKLNKIIQERKKTIYSSLVMTIEEIMQECYEKAAGIRGKNTLRNMRDTIEEHVHDSKNTMFEKAKEVMLKQLNGLKEEVLKTLEETMQKSIELSLKSDGDSIPDVTVELEMVKKYYSELVESSDEEPVL